MRSIELTGSDNRMDCREMFYNPINPLPKKCLGCGFPDPDAVPQPYSLVKSRTLSPNEMALAAMGNLLVRDRVRRIIELLAPRQCRFFPTVYKGTAEETPWYLAVPVHLVEVAEVDPRIRRCELCGQPQSAHRGSQYNIWVWKWDAVYDVVKASTWWGASKRGWDLDRDLFMSVRLYGLLRKLKAKGLDEQTCGKTSAANKEESAWICEKLDLLRGKGIPLTPTGSLSDEDQKWLREYVKNLHHTPNTVLDMKPYEKRLKGKLPQSYKDFITKVGPSSFFDVDEQEGFAVHVLAPRDFDYETYRAGRLKADDETTAVDGVMFARTDHGDCFCFDVRKDRKEFEVFLYLHEMNCFEPYANKFAACIRRFAGHN